MNMFSGQINTCQRPFSEAGKNQAKARKTRPMAWPGFPLAWPALGPLSEGAKKPGQHGLAWFIPAWPGLVAFSELAGKTRTGQQKPGQWPGLVLRAWENTFGHFPTGKYKGKSPEADFSPPPAWFSGNQANGLAWFLARPGFPGLARPQTVF